MMHYKRFLTHGADKVGRVYRSPNPICNAPGCANKTLAKGLCGNHYALMRRNGQPARSRAFRGHYIKNGYRYVLVSKQRYEPEHRLVMIAFLGRTLSSDEHVHHIDGNTLNNSPSNLQLVSRSEHLKIHAKDRPRGDKGAFCKG